MKQQLTRILQHAGEMMLGRGDFAVEQKAGHANFVTSVDKAVEEYLRGELLRLLPGSVMIGEEQKNEPLTDAPTWIVDPIDGTTNFIHNYRTSAVSVALAEGGKPVIGAVFQPYTQELYYAQLGKGADCNGEPLHVTDNPLPRALVGFGTAPYNEELAQRSLELALHFLRAASDVRRCGSAALDLAYVAAGRQDAFFELILNPWDYAAGALLVTEAGGRFTMPQLPAPDYGVSTSILAANAVCFDGALDILRQHGVR